MKIIAAAFLLLMVIAKSSFAQIEQRVRWSYASKTTGKTEAIVYLKASLDKGWHIYSTTKAGGPAKSSVSFSPSKNYALAGGILETKPFMKYESAFHMDIATLTGLVVFQQKVKLITPGATSVTGKFEFTACNNIKCLPPDEVAFTIPISQ